MQKSTLGNSNIDLSAIGIGFVPYSPLGKGFLVGTIDETFDRFDC